MSSEDRDALIAQFQSVTGLDDAQRVTFFLEASNWNVDLAISSFFDDPDGAVNVEPQVAPAAPPTAGQSSQATGGSEAKKGKSINSRALTNQK